jgi:beta-lactamase class A
MHRRQFNIGVTLAIAAAASFAADRKTTRSAWAAIESEAKGRLGVAVLDTASGHVEGWRLDERFPMCSSFKWLLAAAVLRRVDSGADGLDRRVVYSREALPEYAPVSGKHVNDGMSVGELCDAAVTLSDNGAANLLLERLGGPSAVTDIARALGDKVTRLDRNEPTLNESLPGDPRDTSTPRAMAGSMRSALFGTTLSTSSQAQLTQWLVATMTGAHRLRAGLPADWRVGDKTGTGDRGSTVDVAITWPPQRAPVVIAAFLTACDEPIAQREAALAQVGREAARRIATAGS